MNKTVKLNPEEFRDLQRADYELSGMQVLLREFTSEDNPPMNTSMTVALIQQYQLASVNLKQAQLAIYKNHPEIPFNASLNFDFRDETAIWTE